MNNPSNILRDNSPEIMEIWKKDVQKEVYAAKETNTVALYDHLPNIIRDIADILETHHNRDGLNTDEKFVEIIENSEHHGRHRATTALYTVDQVVHEYIIFHKTLSEFLRLHNAFNLDISDLLKYVIETSILKSVGSFSRSIQEMQEKLIGTLAHDIRNPLAAAQLSLELVERDKVSDRTEKMFSIAQRSVRKAISLIEGLMDGITVKAGEGMMLHFEEKELIHDIKWVCNEAKEIYLNDINLNSENTAIIGVFDATAIRRLLENLIGNAVKYGSSTQPVTVSTASEKDAVVIKVHNLGKPISAEKQKYIFAFLGRENKEDEAAGKSWGMGLTLARIVAEAHGGSIELISNQEEGTTFIVTLLNHFNKVGKRRAKLIANSVK